MTVELNEKYLKQMGVTSENGAAPIMFVQLIASKFEFVFLIIVSFVVSMNIE